MICHHDPSPQNVKLELRFPRIEARRRSRAAPLRMPADVRTLHLHHAVALQKGFEPPADCGGASRSKPPLASPWRLD